MRYEYGTYDDNQGVLYCGASLKFADTGCVQKIALFLWNSPWGIRGERFFATVPKAEQTN